MKRLNVLVFSLTIFILLGCTISIPFNQTQTGETTTFMVSEAPPEPSTDAGRLVISMAGGELALSPGAEQWVEGNIRYNVPLWKPVVTRNGDLLEISQELNGNHIELSDKIVNEWELALGHIPMDLEIRAGAYNGSIDLSGIPLTDLDISDGASNCELIFDQLNPVEMNIFRYTTGASNITMTGLGNANFEDMIFEGGVGSYTFDFSGESHRPMQVSIRGGAGSFEVVVPEDALVEVEISKTLGEVSLEGTWAVSGQTYKAGKEGSDQKIEISVNLSLGSLSLIRK